MEIQSEWSIWTSFFLVCFLPNSHNFICIFLKKRKFGQNHLIEVSRRINADQLIYFLYKINVKSFYIYVQVTCQLIWDISNKKPTKIIVCVAAKATLKLSITLFLYLVYYVFMVSSKKKKQSNNNYDINIIYTLHASMMGI